MSSQNYFYVAEAHFAAILPTDTQVVVTLRRFGKIVVSTAA